MRYLIFILFLLGSVSSFAQHNALFRVVAFRGNVKVDNVQVQAGQQIDSLSKEFIVAKGGGNYAYILVRNGYSLKLGPGYYKVKKMADLSRYKKAPRERARFTGAVSYTPLPIVMIGLENSTRHTLMNDSAYLKWKKNPESSEKLVPPFKLSVTTAFGDSLYSVTTTEPSAKLNLRTIAGKEDIVMIGLNRRDGTERMINILSAEKKKAQEYYLSQIAGPPMEKTILDLVIYENDELTLDLMFELDKIKNIDTSTLPTDLRTYLSTLLKNYEIN